MRIFNGSTITVALVLLFLRVAPAVGDGMTITVSNNTTKDLVVTVYDLNANPVQRVLSAASINGFASVTVMIAADDSGHGHLSWAASSVGSNKRCGHHDKRRLNGGDTVHVYANSECATK